jgi:hypothetical protein
LRGVTKLSLGDLSMPKQDQSARLKNIAIAVILIGFGIFMIIAPDIAAGATATGRRSGLKSLIVAVWGIPGGIGALLIGGFIGFRAIKSKPSKAAPFAKTSPSAKVAPRRP